MTTITKVFVILVCLFALIFTPLAIQFAAREHNWKAVAQARDEEAQTAMAREQSEKSAAMAEAAYYSKLLESARQELTNAQSEIAKVKQDLDNVKQERNQLLASRDSWEHSAGLLTAQMNVQSTRNQELTDAREKSLSNERELQTQNIQLTDRVKELTAQVTILNQQSNQRAEELASFREENRKLRDSLKLGQAGQVVSATTPTAVGTTPVVASGPVAGEVTQVNGTMVTLNVGSASGIREGMTMVVTRGGNYICDIEMTKNINPNESVGRIMYEQPGRRIQVNDRVQDATSFEARR